MGGRRVGGGSLGPMKRRVSRYARSYGSKVRDETSRLIPSPRSIVITSTTNRIINNNGNGNKRLSYDPLPYVYMLLPL